MMLRSVPLSRRLVVNDEAGRRARRVRILAGTADWRRNSLDVLGSTAILVAGTRPWPASTGWRWPQLDAVTIEQRLGAALPGIGIDAAVMPRQIDRPRLSLLCRMPGGSGAVQVVVKLGIADDGIENEAKALSLLTERPLPGIATPTVLATGRLDPDVTFIATDALGLNRQRPALDESLRSFERDLAERLASLPRPSGTLPGAVPVHGDLAPWNLRRTGRGLALFDWEAAGWGAPGSDLAFYRNSCDELRAGRPGGWFRERRR
jgi:hypothetical protein